MASVTNKLSEGYKAAKRAVLSAPPNDAYLRWDASGVETIKPDEEEKAQRIPETVNRVQKHNFDKVSPESGDQTYPMRC